MTITTEFNKEDIAAFLSYNFSGYARENFKEQTESSKEMIKHLDELCKANGSAEVSDLTLEIRKDYYLRSPSYMFSRALRDEFGISLNEIDNENIDATLKCFNVYWYDENGIKYDVEITN